MPNRQASFFEEPPQSARFTVKNCIDIWCTEWVEQYDDNYVPLGPDVGALKEMLKALPSMDSDTWRGVCRRACEIGRRVSLGIVARNVNEYTADRRDGKQNVHDAMMAVGRRFLERHGEET